jgi:hypothetical protein
MREDRSVCNVTCAHCRKPFQAEVLGPQSQLAGLKCPHCRLFMPLERVAENDAA